MVTVTELNRAPDGRFKSLEATGTFTDPAGISYNNAINPVQVTEEASTFAESDITLTQTNTTVSDGSVELSGSQTTGDVVVEWDSGLPADLNSYDLATYQSTLDGETVTVDVVETVFTDEVIDDFEDGDINIEATDWSGWSNDTANFSAQQSTVISGSYSGELSTTSEMARVVATRDTSTTNSLKTTVNIGSDVSNPDDNVLLRIDSGNILEIRFNDDGGPITEDYSGTQLRSSWSVGVNYTVKFVFDFANNEADIIINGTNEGTVPFRTSVNSVDNLQFQNRTTNSGATRSAFIDDVIEKSPSNKTLLSNINRNQDISTIDTTKNVKLRANLSRTDTSNNPTVDYLARRFNRS